MIRKNGGRRYSKKCASCVPARQPAYDGNVDSTFTCDIPKGYTIHAMATEEFKINGEELLARVKQLLHEGNVRRIIIKNEQGETIIEIPLTIGAIGALLVPTLAAVGTIAALVTKCTIVVEKK